jgi:hypothetical protein
MAECRRLEALRQRRGIILLPQRNMRPNMISPGNSRTSVSTHWPTTT